MIIEVLLTITVMGSAIYGAVYFRNPIARYSVLAAYITAIFFIWNPDSTTTIAHFFGMGRGLDLLLVVVALVVINVAFVMIRLNATTRQDLTRIARHIALHEAKAPAPLRKSEDIAR